MGNTFERDALAGYLKSRAGALALLAAFFLLLFLVYGLYGLPWGPAAYVALLCLALAAAGGLFGWRGYRRRLLALRLLEQREDGGIEGLAPAADLLENQYRLLLAAREQSLSQAREAARQEAVDATRYYTLWSHQIKTPIAAMRLLLQEEQPDRGALGQELLKTEQYVEMVLQYQRLGGDSNDLVLREYELDGLVKQAIKRVAPLFIHKKIGLALSPLGCRVITDEKWLVFILEQLLTNAVKYTPAGKVSVSLAPESPAELVIADTGIGIRPEDLPRVFEWGYTGCNGRMDKRSTGIGLSLCRQAADMLGHILRIESQVGRGTRVLLDLSRERFEIE